MDNNLFNDLIESCNEAIECEKGNLDLKSVVIDIPDDEVVFYSKYRKLPDNAKQAIHVILDEMLHA